MFSEGMGRGDARWRPAHLGAGDVHRIPALCLCPFVEGELLVELTDVAPIICAEFLCCLRMLKIAVVSITFRTLNNIAPLLQRLVARGDDCEVFWAPTSQRVEGQGPGDFGLRVGIDATGLLPTDKDGLARFEQRCRARLEAWSPDLVISDDMTTWPNRLVYGVVKGLPDRPWHLAWQHGFYQPWYEMRERFDADLFACYGRMHASLLGEALAHRVLPVGLPKLDRLSSIDGSEAGGYLSWFAQPQPDAEVQVRLLADIAQATSLPVRIRPHPAAPHAFEPWGVSGNGLSIDDPATDPIDALRRCNGFLSTHSSAAIEALLLSKQAVLFPSFGLTSFPGYPNVASDFTARAYQVAAKRFEARRSATEAFLADCIGGRRLDHTERSMRALDRLVELRRSGLQIGALTTRHLAALQDAE
jgi:hypothetical protein